MPDDVFGKRIEDSSGDLGTPDVIMMRQGRCVWVELKFAGPNEKPKIRRGQMAFAMVAHMHGVQSYTLIGHPDGSARLLDGRNVGDDWRQKLLARWPSITGSRLKGLFYDNSMMVRGLGITNKDAMKSVG